MIPAAYPDKAEIARLTARMLLEIGAVNFRPEEPFILASGLPSFHPATATAAWVSTQRPIRPITPDSSATGMNSAGEISPRVGWLHRSSASA